MNTATYLKAKPAVISRCGGIQPSTAPQLATEDRPVFLRRSDDGGQGHDALALHELLAKAVSIDIKMV